MGSARGSKMVQGVQGTWQLRAARSTRGGSAAAWRSIRESSTASRGACGPPCSVKNVSG